MKIQASAALSGRRLKLLGALFFLSGASSLIFETIFTRLLTYTFGNTAYASSTVLAAFLGGLALGAFLIGRWVDGRPPSLLIYGGLELLVGIYSIFIPALFAVLTRGYVALDHALSLGSAGLTLVRFVLASTVILIPTILMGGTLPVLARVVAAAREDFEPAIDRLYALNTMGAAAGVLVSTFWLMPAWGVYGTIGAACGINFFLFAAVFLIWRSAPASCLAEATTDATELRAPLQEAPFDSAPPAKLWFILLAAFLTGLGTLTYEVIWTHVLAFLVGNAVYAFGIMLFTLLCGLGGGAYLVSRLPRRLALWTWVLAAAELLAGFIVWLTLPVWSVVPDVFAQGISKAIVLDLLAVVILILLRMIVCAFHLKRRLASWRKAWPRALELLIEFAVLAALFKVNVLPLMRYETTFFVAAEALRFFCAFGLLIIPALLLGVSFPLLLNLASGARQNAGTSVGETYAANTLGSILGSLVAGFALLPLLGSLGTLRLAATLNIVLGLVFLWVLAPASRRWKLALAGGVVAMLALFSQLPLGWDALRMMRGNYVYFDSGRHIDRLKYLREDVQGGLTTVVESGPTRLLLSNGKFQGNNTDEVPEQVNFAFIPVLFTPAFDRALVIGLGTGNTLEAVARFPFQRIDVAELAPSIVDASRRWFGDVNREVIDRDPRVHLEIADGRNFLLLSRRRYDLITLEVTSIWISGEADLYNKEFYELCRARMSPRGVLQQWVQLHHMPPRDLLVIFNTAARVFPHLAFFVGEEQGLLIASPSPLELDYRRIASFDRDPGVRQELDRLGVPSLFSLLGETMLFGDSFQRAVAQMPQLTGLPGDFASTDAYPYLEYQTPKGNTLPYNTVVPNLKLMRSFRAQLLPPDMTILNLPSPNERNLILGLVAEQRRDFSAALDLLATVSGPERERAEHERARIETLMRESPASGLQ